LDFVKLERRGKDDLSGRGVQATCGKKRVAPEVSGNGKKASSGGKELEKAAEGIEMIMKAKSFTI